MSEIAEITMMYQATFSQPVFTSWSASSGAKAPPMMVPSA